MILKNLYSASPHKHAKPTTSLERKPTLKASILKSPRCMSLALASVALAMTAIDTLQAQTYFSLSVSNYSEDFSTVASWTNPTTNSWSGIAAGGTATIPDATRTTASTASFAATGSSGGVQRPTTNIQLLSTGTTANTTSSAIDLNLNFSGRTSGNLSFNAAQVANSTGDRVGSLKVYYSVNGTTWTEITGGGLPFTATNNVASSTAVSVPIPSAVNGQSQVKLRFYYYNGPTNGTNGSRPKISIDNVLVTSASDGVDTTPPALASTSPLSPADNAVNVATNSTLSVTLNEAIAAGTGAITLYKQSDDSVVQSFAVGTSAVTITGATASFTPTSPLLNDTDYYVLIPAGVITDAAASPNSFAGISDKTVWNFKTIPADTTPPSIVSVTPVVGATGIARPTALTITFNENVQVASTGSPKIYIKRVSDDQIASQVESGTFGTASATNNVATIPISPPLDYGTQYYVEIDSGAFEDVSPNNNDYAGLPKFVPSTSTFSWNFTLVSVPSLTNSGPYLQDFSGFTSSATLPSGWALTASGSATTKLNFSAWNTTTTPNTSTGIKFSSATPVTNVFGYQHTGDTDSVDQVLNLTNGTGAEITDLTISYRGRRARDGAGRTPAYTVTLNYGANSVPIPALAYVTSDGDNLLKTASLTGLTIPIGSSFSITWNSNGDTAAGSGNREQIGISAVSVESGAATFPPSVAGVTPSYSSLSQNSVTVGTAVSSDGGSPITERGIVYSLTSVDATPQSGESGVTKIADVSTEVGAFSLPITGLTPGSQYSVASYATNAEGTTHSSAVTIFTLPEIPLLSSQYSEAFDNFTGSIVNGTLPAGWSVVSSGGLNSYAGTWGPATSSGGLVGGVTPGVLGYQHVGGSATVTASLSLKNNTGTTLTQLYVSYLGRVSRADQSREPAWTFSLNGSPVTELDYSTSAAVDATKAKLVTGLSIAPDEVITLTWVSDGNVGTGGARRQIGIGEVLVAVPTAPVLGSASASSITGTTATLNGNVTADGYLPITARGFVYSVTNTNADPIIDGPGVTTVVEGGTTIGSYTSPVTGLANAVGYSLKAYATNSLGTTYSTVASFRTGTAGISYDDWNDAIANQAANLDFDGDGISNGVEFFMGTPGDVFTVNPGISAGTVTWPRASGTLITSFKVEVSTDLTTWTDATVTYPGSVSAPSNGPVTFTLPSGPTSLFIRLNVTP